MADVGLRPGEVGAEAVAADAYTELVAEDEADVREREVWDERD
jgi:hypothetical protein